MYAAPHRSMVFDLNELDEAAVAPAEWDVERLINDAIVGGHHAGCRRGHPPLRRRGGGYQTSVQAMLEEMSILDRYYLRLEPEHYAGKVCRRSAALIQKTISRARTRTSACSSPIRRWPKGKAGVGIQPVLHVDEEIEAPLVESIEEYLAASADVGGCCCCRTSASPMSRCAASSWRRQHQYPSSGSHGWPNDTPMIMQIKRPLDRCSKSTADSRPTRPADRGRSG